MGFQMGLKLQENQPLWRIRYFADMVKSRIVKKY
ncbi:hypothetical protein P872_06885 [Rhodonellum psychrophilum GCM71 = DSM 17998]|uniref:Uncharacterized protein n=1 Tax=Rhodonellum psychrophilum GCM71 = DSM 17998 TaxID=1123057 RepID=U5BZ77_9BACT|nr:hypothetical protein P872_06885 [Rhodonellum psychrophilum GCM71 = DSM 17998]